MQENAKEKGMPLMTFKKALIGLLIPLAVMLPMVLSGVDLLLAYFSAAFFLIIYGLILGFKWDGLSKDMIKGGAGMLEAAIIIALVGGLIGVWIISGTVPAMIYYGLKIISPKLFVPLSFLICIITSLATGSSWGTAGTVGVALFGIASGMGIPLPLTVGALISGSILGDKLSPLSDTTLLASASTNTNIFDHVVSMLYTTVPLADPIFDFICYFGIQIRQRGIGYCSDQYSDQWTVRVISLGRDYITSCSSGISSLFQKTSSNGCVWNHNCCQYGARRVLPRCRVERCFFCDC